MKKHLFRPLVLAGLVLGALACHTRGIEGSQRAFGGPVAERPASVAVLASGFDPDTLVPPEAAETDHDHGTASDGTYSCPHHPEVRATAPGKCPKCGMDLVPSKPSASPGGAPHVHDTP